MSATNVVREGERGNICVGNNVSSFARAFNDIPSCEPPVKYRGYESDLKLKGTNDMNIAFSSSYLQELC